MLYNEVADTPVTNYLIILVKWKEARKQGKPLHLRKPFEASEYEKLIDIVDNLDGKEYVCKKVYEERDVPE